MPTLAAHEIERLLNKVTMMSSSTGGASGLSWTVVLLSLFFWLHAPGGFSTLSFLAWRSQLGNCATITASWFRGYFCTSSFERLAHLGVPCNCSQIGKPVLAPLWTLDHANNPALVSLRQRHVWQAVNDTRRNSPQRPRASPVSSWKTCQTSLSL